MFRHGASVTGLPRTWAGRVVTPEEWRRMSARERHGPGGRLFCGLCRAWVPPDGPCQQAACWKRQART